MKASEQNIRELEQGARINLSRALEEYTGHIKDVAIARGMQLAETVNILPRPVKRDGNGKRLVDYTVRDHYEHIAGEILEALMAAVDGNRSAEREELMDIITVCTSRLSVIGCDTQAEWYELARMVNEKNRKRGYFKE